MSQIAAKQIKKFQQAPVAVSGFVTASTAGTSDNITAALTSAVGTAGDGGAAVPLQVGALGASPQMGVQTTDGLNRTPIYSAATGQRLVDANGYEVYGKITYASAVFTLGYFSAPGGAEAAYTMPASSGITFLMPYIFDFVSFPATATMAVLEKFVASDQVAFAFRETQEVLTVTAANVLSNLSQAHNGLTCELFVNGVTASSAAPNPDFTVSGKVITWSAANAGYALATSDVVKAKYSY